MEHFDVSSLLRWVNEPLFFIGSTAVTLGGLGSALFVFIGALLISSMLQRVIVSRLSRRAGISAGISYAVGRILHYLIVLLGFVLAAQCVGLNLGTLAVVLGFLSVGIGFGLQNVTSNFISGVILLFERPISVGDFISVEQQVGTVNHIGMRSTQIRTLDNVSIVVPNSTFVENQVINWSRGDPRIRLHVPVGVAYGSDTGKVTQALLGVAAKHSDILSSPAPEVRFLSFGNSSLDFELLAWINKPEKQFVIHSQLNYAVDTAFREAGVTIPFPQRDLHVQLTPAIEKLSRSS
jgi:potassium-dependent mechanosensitive channel